MNTMTTDPTDLTTLREAGTAVHAAEDELRAAATELAEAIIEAAPLGLDLPRGYRVVMGSAKHNAADLLVHLDEAEQLCGGGDFAVNGQDIFEDEEPEDGSGAVKPLCAPDGLQLLHFAEDIRDGLLLEIADAIWEHVARVQLSSWTFRAAASAMTRANRPLRGVK